MTMSERVMLNERLDTTAAVALAEDLGQRETKSSVVLDASQVTHFGAQALQVILSARRTFEAAGGSITCVDFHERAENHLSAMGVRAADLTETAT